MNNLLSLKFWFNSRPGPLLPVYQKALIVFLVALLALSILFWLIGAKKKGFHMALWRRLKTFSLVDFFIGLVLLFFSYEGAPFLSSRFWFLFWGAGMLAWLGFIFWELKKIPEKKKQMEREKEYKKYIP
ncbi:hypothetical protein COV49_04185 [Candidatus Falkowbacteria bacterium CG11_big_fil_rev_8_21_14_0_20_39_10]|uniref:Uncharacterized protein n=1 Tax=Candidatus Falkowbacteria bacterium CG11_big_fil_rev_8_21_14_0_20_39_10 TaxID=1974570 RepID=A0A2M6K8C2_9BACT|nr:MAG: hypothetical protein COV49_04185 [Candidatus Falkowbacteria bacterium CG11_big_fil_rev_8_21_14_0_20_39_10]